MDAGPPTEVMYCVLGKPQFQGSMLKSLESLRLSGYDGPVSVLTDLDPAGWGRREVLEYEVKPIRAEDACEGFGGKTVIDTYSSARRTLVLDCDTVVLGSLDELWRALDQAETALCPDLFPTVWQAAVNDLRCKPANNPKDMKETVDLCGTGAAYFNSGVLAFRRGPRTRELFRRWREEWEKYKASNQYALVRALHRAAVTPFILGGEYNTDARRYGDRDAAREAGVKILHFFAGKSTAMFNF